MLELTLDEIRNCFSREYLIKDNSRNIEFSGVSVDTRTIQQGDIFFALKGENFNGNEYIIDAIEKGARLCVIDELKVDTKKIPPNASIIKVDNAELALGKLAQFYLNKLGTKVVGITGSVGKTSTKDMVSAVLSSKFKILKTNGNFNNHIGLPLTVFRLDSSYDIAILEMGMNHAGEIEYLANIANPDVAIITNIGMSHIENLGSQQNILKAKMEITCNFKDDNLLVLNGDDSFLTTVNSNKYKVVKVDTQGTSFISAQNIHCDEMSSSFELKSAQGCRATQINVPGKHNVNNFLLAVAVGEHFGLSIDDMIIGLDSMEKTSMRLDIINNNGYTLINDAYNASPASMKAAIDVARNIKGSRHICVLGTMKELGDMSGEAHKDVALYAQNENIDVIYTTGEYTEQYESVLKEKCKRFSSKEEMIAAIKKDVRKNDVVLIKASRGAKFEEVFNQLNAN